MCRITHDNSYTVKLEDEARQSHNISHRAWATLYRAVNNQDRQLAEEAFDIAYSISENKDSTLGPMYNYYFKTDRTRKHSRLRHHGLHQSGR